MRSIACIITVAVARGGEENKLFIRQEPMLIIGPWVGSVPRRLVDVSLALGERAVLGVI